MATVGQVLTAPEAGWKRYDDTYLNISYMGGWKTYSDLAGYNGSYHCSTDTTSYVAFNFTGKKLRLLGCRWDGYRVSSVDIFIDNVKVNNFSQVASSIIEQSVDFNVENLSDVEHCVKIIPYDSSYNLNYVLDAIDIDENGELLPYAPILTPSEGLLRIIMNDSSEREYKLSASEIDDFVTWFNRTIGTGTTGYVFNKAVQNSKEYLSFEKIISFEVIPLTE